MVPPRLHWLTRVAQRLRYRSFGKLRKVVPLVPFESRCKVPLRCCKALRGLLHCHGVPPEAALRIAGQPNSETVIFLSKHGDRHRLVNGGKIYKDHLEWAEAMTGKRSFFDNNVEYYDKLGREWRRLCNFE